MSLNLLNCAYKKKRKEKGKEIAYTIIALKWAHNIQRFNFAAKKKIKKGNKSNNFYNTHTKT